VSTFVPGDLPLAVAVSMLPASKPHAATVFKQLRESHRMVSLEIVLDALRTPASEVRAISDAATTAADAALATGRRLGMEPIAWSDDRYPALLSLTADPPPVLWVMGDASAIAAPAIAVIGSRAATPYALEVAARLASELARRGMVVVSGLARGVDSEAHRGCLQGGGRTVAVLGSGLDRIYPSEHEGLAATVASTGALVSELGPGAPPLQEHFPWRNRIISGISLGLVVVEASEKSGSLITARCALEQGRDVMAVPGSVLSGRNRGSHALLKDGAKVVETADDILEELGWPSAVDGVEKAVNPLSSDPLLQKMQAGEAYRLDELVALSGQTASKLLPRLLELELLGQVAAAGGGRFLKVIT
jgi:DNA processing protein